MYYPRCYHTESYHSILSDFTFYFQIQSIIFLGSSVEEVQSSRVKQQRREQKKLKKLQIRTFFLDFQALFSLSKPSLLMVHFFSFFYIYTYVCIFVCCSQLQKSKHFVVLYRYVSIYTQMVCFSERCSDGLSFVCRNGRFESLEVPHLLGELQIW